MDKQDGFLESEDILLVELIVEPKVKVNSPNSELLNPTSLEFSKVASKPSLLAYSMFVNCDHFSMLLSLLY